MDYNKLDLNKTISHCKSIIDEMSDCDCKEEHKQLLYFLQELQFRRELDTELPWEIKEIIERFKIEYFYIKPTQRRIANYDFSPFNELLHDDHRILDSPRQKFAFKCLVCTLSISALLTLIGFVVAKMFL